MKVSLEPVAANFAAGLLSTTEQFPHLASVPTAQRLAMQLKERTSHKNPAAHLQLYSLAASPLRFFNTELHAMQVALISTQIDPTSHWQLKLSTAMPVEPPRSTQLTNYPLGFIIKLLVFAIMVTKSQRPVTRFQTWLVMQLQLKEESWLTALLEMLQGMQYLKPSVTKLDEVQMHFKRVEFHEKPGRQAHPVLAGTPAVPGIVVQLTQAVPIRIKFVGQTHFDDLIQSQA
jgi:hypothetical protein